MSASDILNQIVATKAEEVINAQVARPFDVVDAAARVDGQAMGFWCLPWGEQRQVTPAPAQKHDS